MFRTCSSLSQSIGMKSSDAKVSSFNFTSNLVGIEHAPTGTKIDPGRLYPSLKILVLTVLQSPNSLEQSQSVYCFQENQLVRMGLLSRYWLSHAIGSFCS